jgi:hypothetical protein
VTPLRFLRAAAAALGWRALLADAFAGVALIVAIWAGLILAHALGG